MNKMLQISKNNPIDEEIVEDDNWRAVNTFQNKFAEDSHDDKF